MKIYSKARSQWIKFPTKGLDPMVEPHKHNLTLKAESDIDELIIKKLVVLLETYNSDQLLEMLCHEHTLGPFLKR